MLIEDDLTMADTDAAIAVDPSVAPDSEQDKAKVTQITRTVRADRYFHRLAFDRMRRDMQYATWGSSKQWGVDGQYRANITGRHVRQRTAALYAKNPRVKAARRETMDFAVWDENPASLELAQQTIQLISAAQMAAPPMVDQATGQTIPGEAVLPPGMNMGMLDQAMAVVADYQQGTARRTMIAKYGRTIELLFANAMSEQKPLDFKTGMKQVVRRACTTGVGYCELGFQRETGPRPGLTEQLADSRTRLDHLRSLAEGIANGDYQDDGAEIAELELSVAALKAEPEIVLREGLVIDYPQSTKVIPDTLCKALIGFVGARHITIEYIYTVDQVRGMFNIDLTKMAYTPYDPNAYKRRDGDIDSPNNVPDDNIDESWRSDTATKRDGLVCVWKHYDKLSGLVYWIADGYAGFLREPAAPEVFVEDFWPVYALTFNAVENEDELFPPSDVALMLDMQMEHNNSRQGQRDHRRAARPRWVSAKSAFDNEDDPKTLQNLQPLEMATLNMAPDQSIADILQVVPVPGVDPNLYDTSPYDYDVQVVVGAQSAQLGAVSRATATESAIAADSTASSDSSSTDDLDAFLTVVARASGQILQKEMSEEQVKKIVGPGAVWPEVSLADIANEVYLEIAMGSTGKPNQAVEIKNWQQIAPILMQIPGIPPQWMAEQTVRRLDDRLDLNEAYAAGLPSIVSQNAMSQQPAPPAADAGADPKAQGAEGAGNAPAPPGGMGGSDAAFGSNQV